MLKCENNQDINNENKVAQIRLNDDMKGKLKIYYWQNNNKYLEVTFTMILNRKFFETSNSFLKMIFMIWFRIGFLSFFTFAKKKIYINDSLFEVGEYYIDNI